jgi:hypothetical protein
MPEQLYSTRLEARLNFWCFDAVHRIKSGYHYERPRLSEVDVFSFGFRMVERITAQYSLLLQPQFVLWMFAVRINQCLKPGIGKR